MFANKTSRLGCGKIKTKVIIGIVILMTRRDKRQDTRVAAQPKSDATNCHRANYGGKIVVA
jgi:hypothetical protein